MKRILTFTFLLFAFLANAQVKNIFDVARKGNLQEVQELYKKDPKLIDSVDDRKSSPLILASYRGNTEVALFLADKTKNLNYNSGMGTALMAAVMSGNVSIIEKLIAVKADLNQADNTGKTALIYATFFNKTDIVKLLLKAGADKNAKDADARTALDYANFNKNTELIILLDKQ
ncbi:ankyrin repeat domain-containing protein [Flavobacterium sp.]|uniref:ankyrin repeat domain-containing protein n=1 Tax=Flavobacterium sp. TaxID=239 RepID=UPI002635E6CB|nr:ankyrin repeat domain-containing protein [Flavobacterium sp.]